MPDYQYQGKAPKKRLTPLQDAEAVDEGQPTGIGGGTRKRVIDSIVDEAETGDLERKRKGQSTDANNKY